MKSYRGLAIAAALAVGLTAATSAFAGGGSGETHDYWSGAYAGVQAGGGRSHTSNVETAGGYNGTGTTISYATEGALVGAHIGYNWRIPGAVIGIEAEGGWLGVEGDQQLAAFVGVPGRAGDSVASTETDWYAVLAARAGFLLGDRVLAYGKAGIAFVNVEVGFVDPNPLGAVLVSGTHASDTLTAAAIGFGLEYAISHHWTARMEYLNLRFDDDRITHTATVGGGGQVSWQDDIGGIGTVKAAVSYRF